jgi:type III restriction enzyme
MSLDLVERISNEMSLRDIQADALVAFDALFKGILSLQEPIDEIKANVIASSQSAKTEQLDHFMGWEEYRLNRVFPAKGLNFRDQFPRFTFALATGTGKSRLMGAITSYLFLTGKSQHFLLLAPSSEIYRKMKAEALPTHEKYFFKGLSPFPIPEVFSYENGSNFNIDQLSLNFDPLNRNSRPKLFIFTPSQLRAKSGSEAERIMRRQGGDEGEGVFHRLLKLSDLTIFLDEAHRFAKDDRQLENEYGAWTRLVTEFHPKAVIETTATPRTNNTIVYLYTLNEALKEGKYIKDVIAVVDTRPGAIKDAEWDHYTLRMALRYHEQAKSSLNTFVANGFGKQVKPVMLIACADIEHAKEVEAWLKSSEFSNGDFKEKVLRIDSTQIEEELARLIHIEDPNDSNEIIVNVGMLREGWDVSNVYTIVPLRATSTVTLATQTIGRGLRLPFGKRVNDPIIDTLHVMAFGKETVQKVIQDAKQAGIHIVFSVVEQFREKLLAELTKTALGTSATVEVNQRFNTETSKTELLVSLSSERMHSLSEQDTFSISSAVSKAASNVPSVKVTSLQPKKLSDTEFSISGIEVIQQKYDQIESIPIQKLVLDIPSVVESMNPPVLAEFHPQLERATSVGDQRKAYEIKVGSGERIATVDGQGFDVVNWPRRLAELMCREMDDFGGEVKEMERVFREYFSLTGASDDIQIKVIAESDSQIINDSIKNQLDRFLEKLQTSLSLGKGESEPFEFGSIFLSYPSEDGFIDQGKLNQFLPGEKRLITGWMKSLYKEIKFSNNAEFTAAKIIDQSDCKIWVRNPSSQFFITSLWGRHFPDFVVIKDNEITLIEVKRKSEFDNPESEAYKKGKAATEWCHAVSEGAENKWDYWFVPDDEVDACVTIEDIFKRRKYFGIQ